MKTNDLKASRRAWRRMLGRWHRRIDAWGRQAATVLAQPGVEPDELHRLQLLLSKMGSAQDWLDDEAERLLRIHRYN